MRRGRPRRGFPSVGAAVAEIMRWAKEDLESGDPNYENVHLLVDIGGEQDIELEVVSVIGERVLGDLGFGPVLVLARALRPVGAVSVHLIYENQKPVGVALTVQDASFYSTIYEFHMARVERGFEQVAHRHLREGLDLPLIPEGWDAMVELGEWDGCLVDSERQRPSPAGRRH